MLGKEEEGREKKSKKKKNAKEGGGGGGGGLICRDKNFLTFSLELWEAMEKCWARKR